MRIVIAPDSYKGSLSSTRVASTMKRGITAIFPHAEIILKPMADGGEGTVDSILSAVSGKKVNVTCKGPLGEPIHTTYAFVHDDTAVLECANIAGLTQVPLQLRNPENTTTYGLGEVMKHALDNGCTKFIVGLGGSATNDGGLGMLQALGMEAFTKSGEKVGILGRDLKTIEEVCFKNIDSRLKQVSIQVACDVDNPLYGERGASHVFGPQKGATPQQVLEFDLALQRYSSIIEAKLTEHKQLSLHSGAGAAGGLGFAFLLLGANLVSGAELLAKTMNVEDEIKKADLVITGEGQSDEQTLYGKAPGYIAKLAKKYQLPVLLISGSLSGNIDKLQELFDGCFSIINQPVNLQTCMDQAETFLFQQTKQIMHLYQSLKGFDN